MKTYIYLLPGQGYFPGNGCFDANHNAVSLDMVSERGLVDAPNTPITYIRPKPASLSERTRYKINARRPSIQLLSAQGAIDLLKRRGRTLDEIEQHARHHGRDVILPEDIKLYRMNARRVEQTSTPDTRAVDVPIPIKERHSMSQKRTQRKPSRTHKDSE